MGALAKELGGKEWLEMLHGILHPDGERFEMCIRDSLLSFLCLFKKDWQKQSSLALGGVGDKALMRFLSDRPNIKTVYLCLDSDQAGNDACSRLVAVSYTHLPKA